MEYKKYRISEVAKLLDLSSEAEIYRLEMQKGYVLYHDKEIRQIINDWIEKIPFVFSSTLFSLESIYKGEDYFTVGLGIYKEYAELLGIKESEYVKLYPSKLCILTGIQTKSSKIISPTLLQPAVEYMKDQGIVLTEDVITKSVLMRKVNGEYINWHQAWLPFERKK